MEIKTLVYAHKTFYAIIVCFYFHHLNVHISSSTCTFISAHHCFLYGNKKKILRFISSDVMMRRTLDLRLTVSVLFQQRTTHALCGERKQLMITEEKRKRNRTDCHHKCSCSFCQCFCTVHLNGEINKFFFCLPHRTMCLANVSRANFFLITLISKLLCCCQRIITC